MAKSGTQGRHENVGKEAPFLSPQRETRRASTNQPIIMAKTMFQSELSKLGPVKVTVKSDVLQSKYSTPQSPKPPYVVLELNGVERTLNIENDACGAVFDGRKNQTITICAEGSRDEATIVVVGEELPQQQPKPSPTSATHQPPAQHAPAAGMRAKSVRYGYKEGLPNYSSEYIEIEVELEAGIKASDALEFARKFVHSQIQWPK